MGKVKKVGLLATKDDNKSFLLCRKKYGTSKLIVPGGKINPGESDEECLRREVWEELGDVVLESIQHFGTYEDVGVSDDPAIRQTVEIRLYCAMLKGIPVPSGEIKCVVWFEENSERKDLGPIIVNKILPDLIARGKLQWKEGRLE